MASLFEVGQMENLETIRKSIDDIDNSIISLLAERFKLTDRVGIYKAKNGLPAKDKVRESAQLKRIVELAAKYELDPEAAVELLNNIIARVVKNHEVIAQEYKS